MTTKAAYLLDSSLLVALASTSHALHEPAHDWMNRLRPAFATCPITQGALLRIAMKAGGLSFSDAQTVLDAIVKHPNHRFLPDSVPYSTVPATGLQGHQQVTDAYLAQLARAHGLGLATLDRAQAALYSDVSESVV